MTNDRRTACRIVTCLCGVGAAGLGLVSAIIENPPLTDVLVSGHIVGSTDLFASLARQSDLNAKAAVLAAVAAIAAAFS